MIALVVIVGVMFLFFFAQWVRKLSSRKNQKMNHHHHDLITGEIIECDHNSIDHPYEPHDVMTEKPLPLMGGGSDSLKPITQRYIYDSNMNFIPVQ